MEKQKNRHAQALARLGAAKGGAARALKLDPQERREIAREAARARWGRTLPLATHSGELVIGGSRLVCAVLENGTRVLTQETFLKTLGRAPRPKAGTGIEAVDTALPPFLAAGNLAPFISDELREAAVPVAFRTDRGGSGVGYDAILLPMVCEVYLEARDAKQLYKSQVHIAEACDLLVRGLARVGIIALVDEATGYQEERARHELQKILEAYIAAELMPWTKMFPDEFFKQIYRLQGWEYRPGSAKRTPQVGHLINKYIYEQLPPGVLPELRELNPVTATGRRRHKHHQFLTPDTGNPHLDKQISAVTMIMRISDTKEEFERLFAKAYAKPHQARLPLIIEVEGAEDSAGRLALASGRGKT